MKKGCIGCLVLFSGALAALIIGTALTTRSHGGGASANDVSRYAQRVHDLFAVDAVGGHEIASEAASGNIMRAYAAAKQGRDAMDEYRGAYAIDAPSGFDRTADNVNAYISEIRDRFNAEMLALNDRSVANAVEMVERTGSPTHAKSVIESFTSDLAHTNLTKAEKNRVIDRLLGNTK